MDDLKRAGETENARVARAAGVVGTATMLSRVFGFLRDMVVAALFGAGFATDAFFVAFRIPNLLRRLFAEGSLTISFVPVFTEYLKTRSRAEVWNSQTSPLRCCRSSSSSYPSRECFSRRSSFP